MTSQKPPRRHHTVPRFFLERFADQNGMIRVVERDDLSKSFDVNPENGLRRNDFYTIDTDDGPSTEIETYFAKEVENPAAQALRRVIEQGYFTPPDGRLRALSTFFAFQFLRGPGVRSVLVEHRLALARKLAKTMTPSMARRFLRDEEGREPTDDEVAEFVAFARSDDQYTVGFDRDANLANLHLESALSTVVDLIPLFEDRPWLLMHFTTPSLVTSDEPIALFGAAQKPEGPLGLKTAEEIVIPVDSRHAFILPKVGLPPPKHDVIPGSPKSARLINEHIAFGAHRFIVHDPSIEPLRDFTIPKKAPAVVIMGNHVAMSFRPGPARER